MLGFILRWMRVPQGMEHAPESARAGVSEERVQGNYPRPGERKPHTPGNIGLSEDRWVDWLAIVTLFAGLMYAVYLGSTPAGKYQ